MRLGENTSPIAIAWKSLLSRRPWAGQGVIPDKLDPGTHIFRLAERFIQASEHATVENDDGTVADVIRNQAARMPDTVGVQIGGFVTTAPTDKRFRKCDRDTIAYAVTPVSPTQLASASPRLLRSLALSLQGQPIPLQADRLETAARHIRTLHKGGGSVSEIHLAGFNNTEDNAIETAERLTQGRPGCWCHDSRATMHMSGLHEADWNPAFSLKPNTYSARLEVVAHKRILRIGIEDDRGQRRIDWPLIASRAYQRGLVDGLMQQANLVGLHWKQAADSHNPCNALAAIRVEWLALATMAAGRNKVADSKSLARAIMSLEAKGENRLLSSLRRGPIPRALALTDRDRAIVDAALRSPTVAH
jgi:hypothetical protein